MTQKDDHPTFGHVAFYMQDTGKYKTHYILVIADLCYKIQV